MAQIEDEDLMILTGDAAVALIAAVLDGVEWSSDTLDDIANVVRAAGYEIRDPEDAYEDGDEPALD